MKFTPRMLDATLFIARRRKKRDMRDMLALQATAARADGKDLRRTLDELEK